MPNNYQKAKDVFIQRRNSSNKGFEEYPLIVSPGCAIITDNSNNLTSSLISNLQVNTASYSENSQTASYSQTASCITAESASIITGSLYLKSNNGNFWKITIWEDDEGNATIQVER